MSRCYLCDAEAEIHGQDYGRRKVVRCSVCEYCEITNTAISKIEDPSFKEQVRKDLATKVRSINSQEKEAEIVFDSNTLRVCEKPSQ